jgi:YbgC/YbaW family acyl-CoA thioester hydrolase
MYPEFHYHRRVQFAETDMAGIVHFSSYFRYMEEAEHALWRAAGLSIAPQAGTLGWPRVAAAFDYKTPLRFEEEFCVAVHISGISKRTIQYAFTLRRGATVIGHGRLIAACVTKRSDGKIESVALPEGLVERLKGAMNELAPVEAVVPPADP